MLAGGDAAVTTTTMLIELVGLTPGRNLFAGRKITPRRLWLLTAQVDQAELDRRIAALCKSFGISARDLANRADWLYLAIRLAGASYLIWLGIRLLLGAVRPATAQIASATAMRPARAWRAGLITSLTNPKSGAFWTSVFATTFPTDAPAWMFVASAAMIAALSLGWHLGLATMFTSARVQAGYKRMRRAIDGVPGAILVAFGLRLALSRQ
jgi:threonine efflux protein